MKEIYIESEFIKLDQLLKYADIASTGGYAKHLIKTELVKYNGEIETRRGKKIYDGDEVEIDLTDDYNFDVDSVTLKIIKK